MERFEPTCSESHGRVSVRRPGFTLVELLVTIGIIVLMAGILLVVLGRSTSAARRAAAQAEFQTIATALEAYKTDFGDYPRAHPRTPPGAPGDFTTDHARLLCRALIGPFGVEFDGNNGPGFRARKSPGPDNTIDTPDDVAQGKVYGPYLALDNFDINTTDEVMYSKVYPANAGQRVPILYFVAKPTGGKSGATTLDGPNAYISTNPADRPLYVSSQNSVYDASWTTVDIRDDQFRVMLGDVGPDPNAPVCDGSIRSADAEAAATTAPFILWSAGADGVLGLHNRNGALYTDDITNFEFLKPVKTE